MNNIVTSSLLNNIVEATVNNIVKTMLNDIVETMLNDIVETMLNDIVETMLNNIVETMLGNIVGATMRSHMITMLLKRCSGNNPLTTCDIFTFSSSFSSLLNDLCAFISVSTICYVTLIMG